MNAQVVADFLAPCPNRETPSRAAVAERSSHRVATDDVSVIVGINEALDARRLDLREPVAVRLAGSTVPIELTGTWISTGCGGAHAGRCDATCEPRSREWRADLLPERSTVVRPGVCDVSYDVTWTSGWYRV